MDDRAALLAAVCDRPDDDTPRLVFADYLDDHGDPGYARFIRSQIELSRIPEWDRRWLHAWHRDHNLFTARRYRDRFAGLSWIESGMEFRRGFPWGVGAVGLGALLDLADDLFARAPIQSVNFRPDPNLDLRPLVRDPRLIRLRRLGFASAEFGPAEVRMLAGAPHLAGLTELSFEDEAVTEEGAVQLFRPGLPARLTRLRLYHTPLRPVVRGVVGEPGTLRSLVLVGGGMANPFLLELLAAPVFHGLIELDLSRNRLGPTAVAALAASPTAARLESLTMWQNSPGIAGMRALAALPSLRRLSLRDCNLGSGAAKPLAGSPHLRNLTVLDLAGNAIGDKGAEALAASPHLRNLADLNLTGAGLTDRGVAALLDSPVTAGLVRFGVSGDLSAETAARVRERFG